MNKIRVLISTSLLIGVLVAPAFVFAQTEQEQGIKVIWPVKGDKWYAGNTYTISWIAPRTVRTVNIHLLITGEKMCNSRIVSKQERNC